MAYGAAVLFFLGGARISHLTATLATTAAGVFAGGDVAFGPRNLIEAVANGKRAARSIHEYLSAARSTIQVTLDTPAMFMAVLLITMIGMLLYGVVLALERLLVPKDARIG